MNEEMNTLHKNETQDLVSRLTGFHEKFGAISNLHKFILEFDHHTGVVSFARSLIRDFSSLASIKFGSSSRSRGTPDGP